MSEEPKKRKTVHIAVMLDDEEDYEVGKTADDAANNYDDNIGGIRPREAWEFDIDLPLPQTNRVSASVPGEHGTYSLEVKDE
jgi:hypothetical protein